MRILAIETSCDETAIAITDFLGTRKRPRIRVRSHIVLSQIKLHTKFGGVVPNLAKREHQRNLVPILLSVLKESRLLKSKIKNQKSKLQFKIKNIEKILEREPELLLRFKKYIVPLAKPNIDAIAVTYGPGLAPALWVGVNFAKALSALWNAPIIPVNHMAGHLYSAFLHKSGIKNFQFPALALLVSGGHTELVLMRGYGKYKVIGETLDDAAGEAFDKVARLLGLGYPGGPHIAVLSQYAQTHAEKYADTRRNFLRDSALRQRSSAREPKLPRPMMNTKDYNFSFSGLKTAVLYLLRDHPELLRSKFGKAVVAKEFQDAVVEVLVAKTIRAAKEYKTKTILLGGGVAANRSLREELIKNLQKELPKAVCWMPEAVLTGDNALMIALAAFFEKKKPIKDYTKFSAEANLRLS
ncbi:MAG: tRNA (adenosine(37)-N6)-threonylcarbamoyltransferase complex transferase subunit TsaD [bacterium]|nr:tRNA (adenosine(37)-N6)-threonylcarbamoyltransferase complex transferase subunit TsaD [bacterium]